MELIYFDTQNCSSVKGIRDDLLKILTDDENWHLE